MKAASFRSISILITLLLLASMVGVIALVISDIAESEGLASKTVSTIIASTPISPQTDASKDEKSFEALEETKQTAQAEESLTADEASSITSQDAAPAVQTTNNISSDNGTSNVIASDDGDSDDGVSDDGASDDDASDDIASDDDASDDGDSDVITPNEENPALDRLQPARRVEAGMFAFQPLQAYTLTISGSSVNLVSLNAADNDTGPEFVLNGTTPAAFSIESVTSIEETFEQFINTLAGGYGFAFQPAQKYSNDKIDGLITEIAREGNAPFSGRIFMAQPNSEYMFLMVGISPVDQWAETVSDEYDAVLSSISLLDMAEQEIQGTEQANTQVDSSQSPENSESSSSNSISAPASDQGDSSANSSASEAGSQGSPNQPAESQLSSSPSQWQFFSNTNYVNGLALFDNLIWAATDGGVVAWDKDGSAVAKFTTQNGLASNVSTSAEACSLPGFGLIIGTEQGLQILSIQGGSWITLNRSNSLMSADDVVELYCDSANRFLVIGYERNGLDIYDAATNSWSRVDQSSGLTSNLVDSLAVNGNLREIWISSSFGVNVLENVRSANDQRSTVYNSENSPLTSDRVNDIAVSTATNPDGVVWMIEDDKILKTQAREESVVGSTQRDWWMYTSENVRGGQFPTARLISIDMAANGDVWIGSESGELCRFDPINEQCSEFIEPKAIEQETNLEQVYIDRDGVVYYTSAGNGYFRYKEGEQDHFILADEVLKGNHIRDIAQDSSGILWIASDFGIQQIDLDDLARGEAFTSNSADRFRQINSNLLGDDMLGDDLQVIASDGKDGMWLGANGAGYFDGATWRIYKKSDEGLIGSPVQAITVDALGRTWLGTPDGLSILNEDDFYNLTKDEGLPTNNVLALFADKTDSRNIVWIGTNGAGLLRFEDNKLRVFNRDNANMPSNSITALASDTDGSLLVGTTRGLARFDGEEATQVQSVGAVHVTDIATQARASTEENQAANGVWVGTKTDGIFFHNGSIWEQLTTADNLPSEQISSILIDRAGAVWIGGANGGIARFTPAE